MLRFYDSAMPRRCLPKRGVAYCLPQTGQCRRTEVVPCLMVREWSSIAGPICNSCRCYTHHVTVVSVRARVIWWGRDDWLGLSRRTLSFLTPNRFIPALSRPQDHWEYEQEHRLLTYSSHVKVKICDFV